MAIKVKGVKKMALNRNSLINTIDCVSGLMKDYTKENAPHDTGTLESHGIKIKDSGLYNKTVYLDTEGIKSNHPDERQRNRKDGGNYGYYQEVGWTQHGISHPGKFYWDKGFDITMTVMDEKLDNIVKDAVLLK